MIEIPLTQGKVAVVDDEFSHLKNFKWRFLSAGRGYAGRSVGKKLLYLHHVIMGCLPPEGFEVDHLDGDGLNDLKENLRIKTRRENHQNRIIHRSGRLCGAQRHDSHWQSMISVCGRNLYLGYFKTEQEAHEAYLSALKRFFGQSPQATLLTFSRACGPEAGRAEVR